jgi:hypothetical protein
MHDRHISCAVLFLSLLMLLALPDTPAVAQTPPSAINAQSLACTSCPVMEAVFKGSLRLTDDMTTLITQSLQMLVASVLGIWILLQVGKLLFPFGPLDRVPNMLGSITGTVLLAIGVLFIIGSPDIYKRYILHPIMAASVNASNVILDASISIGKTVTPGTASGTTTASPPPTIPQVTWTGDSKAFENQVSQALVDHVKTVHETLQKGICLGVSGTGLPGCMATLAASPFIKIGTDVAKDLAIRAGVCGGLVATAVTVAGVTLNPITIGGAVVVTGVCAVASATNNPDPKELGRKFMETLLHIIVIFAIIIIYGLVWTKYPLYVVDVVIKWAILSILWPLMAAALLLPATRPSAFSALKGLAHAALTLVFLAAVIGASLSVVDQLWTDIAWGAGKDVTLNTKTIAQPDYWMAVLTGLIMLYLMKECPRMAGAFIDSSMDLRVAEGMWQKMKDVIWLAADVLTAGKAGRVKRILNIR